MRVDPLPEDKWRCLKPIVWLKLPYWRNWRRRCQRWERQPRNSTKGASIENLFLISAIIIGFGRSCSSYSSSSSPATCCCWQRSRKSSGAMINLPLEYLKRKLRPRGESGCKEKLGFLVFGCDKDVSPGRARARARAGVAYFCKCLLSR